MKKFALVPSGKKPIRLQLEAAVHEYAAKDLSDFEEIDLKRPIFVLMPGTEHARHRLPSIRRHGRPNIIAAVDHTLAGETIEGMPLWRPSELAARLLKYDHPLAINFCSNNYEKGLYDRFCQDIGLECIDFVPVLRQVDGIAVYTTPNETRKSVVDNLDEYLKIVAFLEDERSKEALLSSIIFKLTCDRDILMPFLTGLHDEYFSYGEGPGGSTFHLSQDETFIDVGANVGQSIRRFLSACNWQFNKIHSFEPDKSNFVALQTMTQMLRHPGIHTHKLALSDHTGTASFVETFAMDSRISEAGNQQVRIEKLDNLIDKATFIKMDVEGHEAKVLRGAEQLIKRCRPRMAVTTYHYPDDLLDVFKTVENMDLGYQFRFHHHLPYYYDDVLYISQPGGW